MINLTLNYIDLQFESCNRKVNILRLIFDKYIYNHISKEVFERSGGGRNNSMVQISDHGTGDINILIKMNKASRRYLQQND